MRRGLVGLLVAQGVSLLGSRMSMLALPWFTLVITGSAGKTGLVAFAEMLPYVMVCAVGGPALDRVGARRASVLADAASAVVVGVIPLLYAMSALGFPPLVGLVGLAGLLRGAGDIAKRVVFPQTVAASGVPLTRATTVEDGLSRLAGLLGAPLAGLLVAGFGAPAVLLMDAATFAFAAALIAVLVPAGVPSTREPYLRSLRTGLSFIRQDRFLCGVILMLLATNLFDAAYGSVLAPVWARDVAGSAVALGLLSGAFGLGAVLGNVAFAVVAPKVPRYAAFTVGFLVGGAPRFLAPALTRELWLVYAVAFVGGAGIAAVNPILGAVMYERVPAALQSRVLGLAMAAAWAGIPLGGLLGGWAVDRLGLTAGWLAFGGAYLLVTLVQPATSWRSRSWTATPEAIVSTSRKVACHARSDRPTYEKLR